MTSKYIILDRDGVINKDSDHFIKSPQEWQPIEGSLEAIALLHQHGFMIVVITNQSGIARGLFDEKKLSDIHDKMLIEVKKAGGEINAIYYCPHGPEHDCLCRKPKPGMMIQFSREYDISLSGMPMIGDSMRDLQAAIAVNGTPILVKTGKGEKISRQMTKTTIPVFENLYEASISLIKSKYNH